MVRGGELWLSEFVWGMLKKGGREGGGEDGDGDGEAKVERGGMGKFSKLHDRNSINVFQCSMFNVQFQ